MEKDHQKPDYDEWMDKEPTYPQRAAEHRASIPNCEGVYAGPVPCMPMAMVTYAGPDMINSFPAAQPIFPVQPMNQAIGADTAPRTNEDDLSDRQVCAVCGASCVTGAKFCSECGSILQNTPSDQGGRS